MLNFTGKVYTIASIFIVQVSMHCATQLVNTVCCTTKKQDVQYPTQWLEQHMVL